MYLSLFVVTLGPELGVLHSNYILFIFFNFGRVERYEAPSNQALLSEPNNNSGKLLVDASLTDADNFRPGSLVMLIGELGVVGVDNTGILNLLESGEANEGIFTGQIPLILTARVAVCVDRLDYTLYARAVQVWRDLKEEQT